MIDETFHSEIISVDDEAFEAAFEEAPKLPTADQLKTPGEEDTKDKEKEKKTPAAPPTSDIEEVDFEEEEAEEEKTEKKAPEKKAAAKDKTPEPAPKEEETEEEETEEEEGGSPDKVALLKAHAQHLIETGVWDEVEDFDQIEWTDEVFTELSERQSMNKAETYFNELVDRSGVYGKTILAHIENGGNPDDVIDIFKEQKAFEAIDVKEEAGQENAVAKYYKEVLEWDDKRIKRHIERLKLDEELKEEAEMVQSKFEKHTQKKLAEVTKAQEAEKQRRIDEQKEFETGIQESLNEREDLETARKKDLERQIFVRDVQLKNGQKVTRFHHNFVKIQSDPKLYLKLVEFCENPEKYETKVAEKKVTEKAKKTIKFLSGNATATNKAKSQVKAGRVSSDKGLNW